MFCSIECREDRRKGQLQTRKLTWGLCEVEDCGKPSRSSGAKSPRLCEMHYGRIRTNGTLNRVLREANRICHYCGGPARKQRLFCSDACRRRDRMGIAPGTVAVCETCGGDIDYGARPDRKFCSLPCQRISERGRRYGLASAEAYELLSDSASCMICHRQDVELHIDHNHATGEVRGVLCTQHNVGLGMMGESIEYLQSAIKYLEKQGTYGVGRLDQEADASQGLAPAS